MKKYLHVSIFLGLLFFIVGCGNKKVEETKVTESIPIPTAEVEEEVEIRKIGIPEEQLALEIDPICGMPAYKYLADTVMYQGKTYGFCGAGCKMAFQETPDIYIEKHKI